MDKEFDELKQLVAAYKAAPPQNNPVGVFDWTMLLALLPALLSIFVKDANLAAIITKVIDILKGLFTGQSTGSSQP